MIAALTAKIGADITGLTSGLKKAGKDLNKFGSDVSRFGAAISVGISAPLTAAATQSVKAFDTQIQAEKRLEAALRSAGEFSQAALQDFKSFASGLQQVTTVGDESTLKMLQLAKSMGLSNEQAKSASKNAISLAKAMGINEQSAIRYTAALEQGDATMLNRYLPTLRQIDDETERAAKAQELLGQMFSAATSEAQNGLGPLIQLQNTLGDFQEDIGAIVLEYMQPFIDGLKDFVTAFKNSSDETKRFITQVVLIGSVAGPAIVTLGLAIKGLALGFATLLSPVALTVAAIATLAAGFIYAGYNFDAIVERFKDISWWKNSILDMAAFFAANMPLLGGGVDVAAKFLALKTPIDDTKTEFKSLSEVAKEVFADITGLNFDKVFTLEEPEGTKETGDSIKKSFEGGVESVSTMSGLINNTLVPSANMAKVALTDLPGLITTPLISAAQAATLLTDITNTFTSSFGQGMANVVVQGEKLVDTLKNIGKLLASAVIQKGISILLTGGLGGTGFFGDGGGIFGSLLGKLTGTKVNDALITSAGKIVEFHPNDNILAMKDLGGLQTQGGTQKVQLGGEFRVKGTDLVLALDEANYSLGR
jgi:hypothetical protein